MIFMMHKTYAAEIVLCGTPALVVVYFDFILTIFSLGVCVIRRIILAI